jgi:hypothetical protein
VSRGVSLSLLSLCCCAEPAKNRHERAKKRGEAQENEKKRNKSKTRKQSSNIMLNNMNQISFLPGFAPLIIRGYKMVETAIEREP